MISGSESWAGGTASWLFTLFLVLVLSFFGGPEPVVSANPLTDLRNTEKSPPDLEAAAADTEAEDTPSYLIPPDTSTTDSPSSAPASDVVAAETEARAGTEAIDQEVQSPRESPDTEVAELPGDTETTRAEPEEDTAEESEEVSEEPESRPEPSPSPAPEAEVPAEENVAGEAGGDEPGSGSGESESEEAAGDVSRRPQDSAEEENEQQAGERAAGATGLSAVFQTPGEDTVDAIGAEEPEEPAASETDPETATSGATSPGVPWATEILGPPLPGVYEEVPMDTGEIDVVGASDTFGTAWPSGDFAKLTTPPAVTQAGEGEPEKPGGGETKYLWWLLYVTAGLGGVYLIYFWLRRRPQIFDTSSTTGTPRSRRRNSGGLTSDTEIFNVTSTGDTSPVEKEELTSGSKKGEGDGGMPIWHYPDEELARRGIDPEYRQVFKLYYGRGMNVEQIAEECGYGAGEVGLVINLAELITRES